MLHIEIKKDTMWAEEGGDFVGKLRQVTLPIIMIPMDRGFCITLHKAKAAI
jgi:hypothetical protein